MLFAKLPMGAELKISMWRRLQWVYKWIFNFAILYLSCRKWLMTNYLSLRWKVCQNYLGDCQCLILSYLRNAQSISLVLFIATRTCSRFSQWFSSLQCACYPCKITTSWLFDFTCQRTFGRYLPQIYKFIFWSCLNDSSLFNLLLANEWIHRWDEVSVWSHFVVLVCSIHECNIKVMNSMHTNCWKRW